MRHSDQDNYYRHKEGNDFFVRNHTKSDIPRLRKAKVSILEHLDNAGITPTNVIEFGCCYGDLLAELARREGTEKAWGVEASSKAVDFGRQLYNQTEFRIIHGTIADNELIENSNKNGFDLIIIDDVFGWVSRETILQSVTNIDYLLKDGGFVFIRDFYPNKRVKNRNHHIEDALVYNFKVVGSHSKLFESTGMYVVDSSKIFMDNLGISTDYKCDNPFNYRWADIILRKSLKGFFDEVKRIE